MPAIVAGVQSRLGIISVAARVRQENSSIRASNRDAPVGAAPSKSALAAAEVSDAPKPRTRSCLRYAATRADASHGAAIATTLSIAGLTIFVTLSINARPAPTAFVLATQ